MPSEVRQNKYGPGHTIIGELINIFMNQMPLPSMRTTPVANPGCPRGERQP